MATYIILSGKAWNLTLPDKLAKRFPGNQFVLIKEKDEFNEEVLKQIKPSKIFIPHWSFIIPESIVNNFECVVFHETDLPFGRGGSPIQNLIARGYKETKISAIRAEKGLDTGPIYMKKDLSLLGTAEEIFIRANSLCEEMIEKIIEDDLSPKPQVGEPVVFKRRKPEQGNLAVLSGLNEIYDYIRMLDADGYPNAFIDVNGFRYVFTRASLKANETIIADVRISKI